MGVIDLRQAIKVRGLLNVNRADYHIGIINKDVSGGLSSWRKGDIVLFRPYKDDENHCAVETPMNDEWIANEKAHHSGLRTIGCCVGFPVSYIDEVIV